MVSRLSLWWSVDLGVFKLSVVILCRPNKQGAPNLVLSVTEPFLGTSSSVNTTQGKVNILGNSVFLD